MLLFVPLLEFNQLRSVRTDENDAAARAIAEFDASLESLRPSTQRLYLAGAKALLRAAFPDPAGLCDVASYAELWARTRDVKPPKLTRARPFLRFLESRQAPAPPEDLEAVRAWVLEALNQANRLKNPSVAARRDAALLAALCAAPTRGNPRAWPKGCLAVTQTAVTLWEGEVRQPALGLALRYWHLWRERLARPDQRRLHRKSLAWGRSALLFPGPGGAPLAGKALHNALRRLTGGGEGSLTPEKIRAAFLAARGRPPTGPASGGASDRSAPFPFPLEPPGGFDRREGRIELLAVEPVFEFFERRDVGARPKAQGQQGLGPWPPKRELP
jgi:hypothetical protein